MSAIQKDREKRGYERAMVFRSLGESGDQTHMLRMVDRQPLYDALVDAAKVLYGFEKWPEGNEFLLSDVNAVAPGAQELWNALAALDRETP